MSRKLSRDLASADLSQIDYLISTAPDDDLLGRMSLEARRAQIRADLQRLDQLPDVLADVTLLFGGDPVDGTTSIEAGFAGKVLDLYQDLVAKTMVVGEQGGLARRGRLPDRPRSRLAITALARGSFGFVLEEKDIEGQPLFRSAMSQAVEAVTSLFDRVASQDDAAFAETLDAIDPRVLTTVRHFFKALRDDGAVFKLTEGDRERRYDRFAIERAYQRTQETDVVEDDIILEGTLIGVVPVRRIFEFRIRETGEVISGKVGPAFSREYLERVDRSEAGVGSLWRAVLVKRTTKRSGTPEKVEYTLQDLHSPLTGLS
jgi:hypothetical protein